MAVSVYTKKTSAALQTNIPRSANDILRRRSCLLVGGGWSAACELHRFGGVGSDIGRQRRRSWLGWCRWRLRSWGLGSWGAGEKSEESEVRILVKAQPSTQSTGPRSPTRLGIRSQDLGLLNEYSLGHCGLSAACTHKLAFTRRLYALLTATDTTALD